MIKVLGLLLASGCVFGEDLTALTILDANGDTNASYSVSLQLLAIMSFLTILPGIILSMTSFTRVVIVLGILRQAMGMAQTPNNQIIIGLSLFLTAFIMAPIFSNINENALQPYLKEEINAVQAVNKSLTPIKSFMTQQTRETDLNMFLEITNHDLKDEDDIPLNILLPSFVTSELKTAFQIGFFLFIPFLVIDLVVASILMAMGMMMLSPLIISLPFKIMLFILVDGWALVLSTLAGSFGI